MPTPPTRRQRRPFPRRAGAAWRAAALATAALLGACGGGDGGRSAPPPAPAAPATTAEPAEATTVGSAAPGRPVALRLALGANGDAFAVWRADDGGRLSLWAARWRADLAAWDAPAAVAHPPGHDVDDFDLVADARGNATVAWHASSSSVSAARFDAATGAWAAPVTLNEGANQPRLAVDASGRVLALYAAGNLVRGRFFDPVAGAWRSEDPVEQNTTGTGFSGDPLPLLRDSGEALAVFQNGRTGAGIVASNFYEGAWQQLPPDSYGLLGAVPGSLHFGSAGTLQLAGGGPGHALLAWDAEPEWTPDGQMFELRLSRFSHSHRAWSEARTLLPASAERPVRLQRLGSDAGGRALLLWTEAGPARTALKAMRLNAEGAACSAVFEIDTTVGGSAAAADLAVLPTGEALAVWLRHEGGRADDAAPRRVALNRFDPDRGTWGGAVFAPAMAGQAGRPSVSAAAGQALVGWIQAEADRAHVKVMRLPLREAPAP